MKYLIFKEFIFWIKNEVLDLQIIEFLNPHGVEMVVGQKGYFFKIAYTDPTHIQKSEFPPIHHLPTPNGQLEQDISFPIRSCEVDLLCIPVCMPQGASIACKTYPKKQQL